VSALSVISDRMTMSDQGAQLLAAEDHSFQNASVASSADATASGLGGGRCEGE